MPVMVKYLSQHLSGTPPSQGSVGMLINPCDLISLNNIERNQPRIMCAAFNGKPCTIIATLQKIAVVNQRWQPSAIDYLSLLETFPNTTF